MEKTLMIGGRQVRFKTSGAALLIYSGQTGRDFLVDLLAMYDEKTGGFNPAGFSTVSLLDMCWVLARTADPSIPEPMTWLDGFDTFPVIDIFEQLSDLMLNCLTVNVKTKNAAATAGLSRKQSGKKPSRRR